MKVRAAVALAGVAALLSGCVAAAVPIAAGGILARSQVQKREPTPPAAAPSPAAGALRTEAARASMRALEGRTLVPVEGALPPPGGGAAQPERPVVLTDLAELPPPGATVAPAPAGAAAAASIQGYQALWNHVRERLAARGRGKPLTSVVLAEGARLDAPRFASCGNRRPAVLVDLDESAVPGSQALGRDPDGRWRRWRGDGSDALAAAPGAAETLAALRREGVDVVFVSSRSAATAAQVVSNLNRFDLGPAAPGDTLRLRGGESDTLDAGLVRRAVARDRCVVALVGDELADFSDLFEASASPAAAAETMIAPLWGAGWFMLPAPLYSTATPTRASPAPQPSGVR